MFYDVQDDYFSFLRFQTIATDPLYSKEVENCANWLELYLRKCGLSVEKWNTRIGPPTLFASDLSAGPDKETILLYCHYDVQPVDPLDLWDTPPFEPNIRNGKVYARGASDNKGQCFYTICALKDYLKHHGKFPVNIKFVIEGEEESGSRGLSSLLEQKRNELKADHLLVVDSSIDNIEDPFITLGARGIVGVELTIEEAPYDLHSGLFGGIAYNPNRALVELLSLLHDSTGTVAIAGFYDEVIGPTPQELSELSMDFDEKTFIESYGFRPTGMEDGLNPIEANWFRPTLEINGIAGGYAGVGFKTVIPSKAVAKISCRLVPQQTPERIISLLKEFLLAKAPKGLKVTIESIQGSGKGFRHSAHSRIAKIMTQSYSDVFQKPCKKILIGASVPITPALMDASKAEGILIGTALNTDLIHSPNEHFSIESFEKGYNTIYRMLELFA